MTAPTKVTRGTPPEIADMLLDGYQVFVALEDDPDLCIWEDNITPPSMTAGSDVINTTTQWNATWMTKAFHELLEVGETTINAAYCGSTWDKIQAIIGVNQSVTVHFPDGSTLSFWGGIRSFTPAGWERNGFPKADIVIVCTNMDDSNNEEGPVWAAASGTA